MGKLSQINLHEIIEAYHLSSDYFCPGSAIKQSSLAGAMDKTNKVITFKLSFQFLLQTQDQENRNEITFNLSTLFLSPFDNFRTASFISSIVLWFFSISVWISLIFCSKLLKDS